jgi:succinate dehydrogenase / fumarate reductase cytochrome b subunit
MSAIESNPKNPIASLATFFSSSIGTKMLMAFTGFLLWGFALQHMLMNLQVFIPEHIEKAGYFGQSLNEYAFNLKSMTPVVWGGRAFLLTIFVLHIVLGIRLARMNRMARAVRYDTQEFRRASFASRTMPLTGLAVLGFIAFHIAHFTLGVVQPDAFAQTDSAGLHHVAQMMWDGFKVPWIVALYLVGNILLFTHLYHGSASLFQSIGWRHPVYTPLLVWGGRTFVAGILAGNIAMPVVLFAWGTMS